MKRGPKRSAPNRVASFIVASASSRSLSTILGKSWFAITVSWVESCVFCHLATHVLKRDAIMSTGVQKCDVPLITSSASCGFAPILIVHRCASLAPWFIAAAAHSFAAARPSWHMPWRAPSH